MAKVLRDQLTVKEREELKRELIAFLQHLGVKGDRLLLLWDMLTESERIMLARRVFIAKNLLAGKTFLEIAGTHHIGLDTVHSVHRWLNRRVTGYRNAVKSTQKTTGRGERTQRGAKGSPEALPYSWKWLCKRYPSKMWLLEAIVG